jgi:ribonuclease BN (tRNA processing enzyme)
LTSAREAGRQAAEAGAQHLILTHLMPGTNMEEARTAAATGYDRRIEIAAAGLTRELSG